MYLTNREIQIGLRRLSENGKGLGRLGIGALNYRDPSFQLGDRVASRAVLQPKTAQALDVFATGRLFLTMFSRKPEHWNQPCAHWETRACSAALDGGKGILSMMQGGITAGVSLQQPQAAERIADLLALALSPDPVNRIEFTDFVTHPSSTIHILSPSLEEKLSQGSIHMDGGFVRNLKGNVKEFPDESIQGSDLPPVAFAKEEGKGMGVKIARDANNGALIGFYAGEFSHRGIMTKEKPSRYIAAASGAKFKQNADITSFRCDAGPSKKLTFQWCIENCVCGPFMNGDTSSPNCRLDRNAAWVDREGIVWMPMYAIKNIKTGEFLCWNYNHEAGQGLEYNFKPTRCSR